MVPELSTKGAGGRRGGSRTRLAPAAALAAMITALFAAALPAPSFTDERLARLDREIDRLTVERDKFRDEGAGVLAGLEELSADARLLDAKLERARLSESLSRDALDDVERDLEDSVAAVEQARAHMRGSVRFLYMLGPGAGMRLMFETRRAQGMAGALRAAQELGGRFQEQLTTIRTSVETLDRVLAEEAERFAELEEARRTVARVRGELEDAISRRESVLASLSTRGDLRDAAIAELKRARGSLAERIESGTAAPSEIPDLDVAEFRGLLKIPARGKVSVPFGPRRDSRLGTMMPHPGWGIDAPFGEHVRAPFQGRVAWSGWLRGYGLVAVLDHGRSVHTVYAHLSALLVDSGQEVAEGQVIASVGDTGSLEGARLYLEVREGGKAVDPSGWFDREGGGT